MEGYERYIRATNVMFALALIMLVANMIFIIDPTIVARIREAVYQSKFKGIAALPEGVYYDRYDNATIILSYNSSFVDSMCEGHVFGCCIYNERLIIVDLKKCREAEAKGSGELFCDYVLWHELCHLTSCYDNEECAKHCGDLIYNIAVRKLSLEYVKSKYI